MGHHLTKDGKFKSDKYPWCPEGFIALKFTDPVARIALEVYALNTEDKGLADDIERACRKAAQTPPPGD